MKGKKTAAKSQPQPAKFSPRLTDLQEFQKAYGPQWLSIVRSEACREGMFLLNRSKLDLITNLSNEDIEKHSREILSDLRGHLKHEMDMVTLHTREEALPGEETEDYFSPDQIAKIEMMRDEFRKNNQQSRYA